MSDLQSFIRLVERIDDGEPLRILVGAIMHRATEIVPSPDFARRIAEMIRADAVREIERLSPPPQDPAPASPAMPVPQEEKAS